MREILVAATEAAIHSVDAARFFRTERGFQGRFYCALQSELDHAGLLTGGAILEIEYQKWAAHGMGQRPDIIFHVPIEHSGTDRNSNNFAVWALKRKATVASACDDFAKLNQMFLQLNYPIGFFVNIDAEEPMAIHYQGEYGGRLLAVSAGYSNGRVSTTWASSSAA